MPSPLGRSIYLPMDTRVASTFSATVDNAAINMVYKYLLEACFRLILLLNTSILQNRSVLLKRTVEVGHLYKFTEVC